MIKGVNEIAFNNEANIKLRESKNEKYNGFDKFVKKYSKNKSESNISKDKVTYEKDNKSLKSTKENSLQVKDSEIKDIDIKESLKNTNEQIYLLIQNLFFQNIPENLEDLLKNGNELEGFVEKLILNVVEDEDFKEVLNGINIKDLGLEEKINKEEFKETLKQILQIPKGEEEPLNKIKTTISSLIKEEILPKKEVNLNNEFADKNTMVNINNKAETKTEDFSKSSSDESFSKEDSEENVLKNILGDKEDNKFSKTINFMNQFNKISNVENLDLENIENIVVNKETLNGDVIKVVKYMEVNDIKNLTVKINPKELGEMVIKITMENGKMKANITANNKEAFNLLNANLQDITDKLQKGAVKIENFSLNLYEDTTFFSNDKDKSREGFKENNKNSVKENLKLQNDVIEDTNDVEDLSNISILA
ncbi:flagellar hook-length control protein FliK [Clostridium tetani]|nr:flagellar hook-length control protein FliK [Clostridium tetani]RXI61989.1 flagellar hook-length control protein FliK [Clostridium tetani]RXI64033.1 flagellar hook-length control protein FliK [Clostridium tetani]RXI65685.1 flagellar hook-length control protein FliK [Clostridium tetani]RXI71567.1 flagellar hook-length control protein FliK [Clostridium tetani]RXM56186.1 flagellar hook-length control protein FliK [Clostridium tetani]